MKLRYFDLTFIALFMLGCSNNKDTASFEQDARSDIQRDGGNSPEDSAASSATPCGAERLEDCVEKARYVTDLEFIAQERPSGSEHWQAVQNLCADRFAELGYEVERQDYGTGVNVIGVKPGNDKAAEKVLLSAHYDHIAGCPGADDNATGVAGVLEAARVLSFGEFTRTLVVACWDQEELGLIGSSNYAQRALEEHDTIRVSYVYEMIGFKSDQPNSQRVPAGFELLFPEQIAELEANEYRGDFVTLIYDSNSNDYAASMVQTADRIGLPIIALSLDVDLIASGLVSDLLRSDHSSFWNAQYPAIMITDSSEFRNAAYHCQDGIDSIDSLNHDFAAQIIQATIGSVAASLTE